MKTKLLFAVSVVAALTLRSAAADPVGPAEGFSFVPPFKILATARSGGFEPLGPPMRRGQVYWLRAINPRGQDVAVILDAASGRILSVSPIGMPPLRYGAAAGYEPIYGPPPPYARIYGAPAPYGRPGPYAYGPPGYGPRAALTEDGDEELTPPGLLPNSRAAAPFANQSATATTPRTPLPRPRPPNATIASSEAVSTTPPTQTVPTQTLPQATVGQDQTASEKPATKPTTDLPPVTPLD